MTPPTPLPPPERAGAQVVEQQADDIIREWRWESDMEAIEAHMRAGGMWKPKVCKRLDFKYPLLHEKIAHALTTTAQQAAEAMREAAAKVASDHAESCHEYSSTEMQIREAEAKAIAAAIRALPPAAGRG